MGHFYVNFSLRGPTQAALATALVGRSAIVAPSRNGCVVVYDEEAEDQDVGVIAQLAIKLSGNLECAVLAVLNHDDDVLWYQLYDRGRLVDSYDSWPGYFEETAVPDASPRGGNSRALSEAFASNKVVDLESILRKPNAAVEGYGFAVDRHRDLVSALGLSEFAVGFGYRNVSKGSLPPGVLANDLIELS
jgi:hypothetical protein